MNSPGAGDTDYVPGTSCLSAGSVPDESFEPGHNVRRVCVPGCDDIPSMQILVAPKTAFNKFKDLASVTARS